MLRNMLYAKIHRATVTEADLHYVGSCTIDQDLLDAAGLANGEKVDIVDVTNGSRLTTYVIPGERGSGKICINGAAAHLVHPGDMVIMIAYAQLTEDEVKTFVPKVIFVDENNKIVDIGDDPALVPDGFGLESSGVPRDEIND